MFCAECHIQMVKARKVIVQYVDFHGEIQYFKQADMVVCSLCTMMVVVPIDGARKIYPLDTNFPNYMNSEGQKFVCFADKGMAIAYTYSLKKDKEKEE